MLELWEILVSVWGTRDPKMAVVSNKWIGVLLWGRCLVFVLLYLFLYSMSFLLYTKGKYYFLSLATVTIHLSIHVTTLYNKL